MLWQSQSKGDELLIDGIFFLHIWEVKIPQQNDIRIVDITAFDSGVGPFGKGVGLQKTLVVSLTPYSGIPPQSLNMANAFIFFGFHTTIGGELI